MKIIELDDTLEQIKDDPEKYQDLFFENKVLVFRNMAGDLVELSRELTGYRPVPMSEGAKHGAGNARVLGGYSSYCMDEDHKVRFEQFWTGVGTEGEEPDNEPRIYTGQNADGEFYQMDPVRSTFMFWHLEDAYKEFPPTAIVMSMKTFTAPEGAGGSGFVDMADAYRAMKPEWQHALRDATKEAIQVPFMPDGCIQHPHPIIMEHFHTGELFLPLQGHWRDCDETPYTIDLATCDGLSPDDLLDINEWVYQFQVNPDNQHWVDHEEGDIVVYDGQSLSYAIGAGFSYGERVFDRVTYHAGEPSVRLPPRHTQYHVPDGHVYHG